LAPAGFADAASEAAPDSAAGDSLKASTVEDVRAELNARLGEARKRQRQASVDGVLYIRWNDDLAQRPGTNQFVIDRAYLNVRGQLNRKGVYRLTLDAARTSGERLLDFIKYAYGGVAFSPRATVLFGMQTTPLVDFEEGVWKYRFVQKVMSDNEGKLSS